MRFYSLLYFIELNLLFFFNHTCCFLFAIEHKIDAPEQRCLLCNKVLKSRTNNKEEFTFVFYYKEIVKELFLLLNGRYF